MSKKYPRMRLTLDQLRFNITPQEREKCIKTMMMIIGAKDASYRDKSGAVKNILLMTRHDVDVHKVESPQPDKMTIIVQEIEAMPLDDQEQKEEQ